MSLTPIYILFLLPMMLLHTVFGESSGQVSLVLSFAMIALVGIPHGAIDHIVIGNKGASIGRFLAFYLGSMLLYLLGWIYLPFLSLVAFIILSSYHFGQAQYSSLLKDFRAKRLIYLSWGSIILSALFLINAEFLQELLLKSADADSLLPFFNLTTQLIIFGLSASLYISMLVFALRREKIRTHEFYLEIFLTLVILTSFTMLSLALAFALFFSIIHSLRVLKQEYRHLMVLGIVDSFRSFIKKLIPLTLISLIGIAGLSFFQREGILPVSELVLIMITVSLVTLPHSIVMESFYKERG